MLVFVLVCITFYVLSRFAVILTKKRELIALLLLSFWCLVTINVLWLFFTVAWVGMHNVIVIFSDSTQLLFFCLKIDIKNC